MNANKTSTLKARIEELEQLLDLERQEYDALLRENDRLRDQVRRLQARAMPQRRITRIAS
jgi:cell division septum initiation protein DivIVA